MTFIPALTAAVLLVASGCITRPSDELSPDVAGHRSEWAFEVLVNATRIVTYREWQSSVGTIEINSTAIASAWINATWSAVSDGARRMGVEVWMGDGSLAEAVGESPLHMDLDPEIFRTTGKYYVNGMVGDDTVSIVRDQPMHIQVVIEFSAHRA